VATVLDDLVGQGRTVGIVTHVRELADRMPVRFEVTKGPETASVEKVMT
jgi:DNA repair protein SbcC/Rad50